jgi:type II secretory pathway component PulK
MRSRRSGFTMITVLWVMTVASIMAAAAALTGRNTVNATRNRTQLERAYWIASGCAARARAAIDDTLAGAATFELAADRWRVLDRTVSPVSLPRPGDCSITLEAAGTRIDVNAASAEMIEALLRGLGHGDEAIGMTDALADWRDTDDVALPSGAERAWYESEHRDLPRNGSLADVRELARVRGFENLGRYDTVLTTEPGRVSLATAPVSVLLAVPGFTRETAERIAALSAAGTPARDILSLLGSVSAPSAAAIMGRYSEIARVTTPDPDAWILTVQASSGLPPSTVVLHWRLVRAGKHCVVARTRSML